MSHSGPHLLPSLFEPPPSTFRLPALVPGVSWLGLWQVPPLCFFSLHSQAEDVASLLDFRGPRVPNPELGTPGSVEAIKEGGGFICWNWRVWECRPLELCKMGPQRPVSCQPQLPPQCSETGPHVELYASDKQLYRHPGSQGDLQRPR